MFSRFKAEKINTFVILIIKIFINENYITFSKQTSFSQKTMIKLLKYFNTITGDPCIVSV